MGRRGIASALTSFGILSEDIRTLKQKDRYRWSFQRKGSPETRGPEARPGPRDPGHPVESGFDTMITGFIMEVLKTEEGINCRF